MSAETTDKAAEILQSGQTPQQMEAFPSQEARVDAILDAAIAEGEAKQAELAEQKPTDTPEKPKEPVEATPETEKTPEPAPEPEKEPVETSAEEKQSALDRFKASAAEEAAKREEKAEVKEWRDKYTALEGEISELRTLKEQLRTDPLSFFEKHMPVDTYEKLTDLYAKGEKPTAEKSKMTAIEKKLDQVMEAIAESKKTQQQTQQEAWIQNFTRDLDTNAVKEEFAPIREYSARVEELTGQPVNLHMAAAKEFDDFMQMYKKALTPYEVLEILKEKAEERLASIRPKEQPKEEKKPEPKRAAKKPAPTVTNELETESDSANDSIPFKGDKEQHIQAVIEKYDSEMWQGNPSKN